MRLAELLVQEGVAIAADELRRVLRSAEESGQNAVVALVEQGVIGEDVLAEVLARACGTVVVHFDRVDPAAAGRITKAVALEQLALPISASGGGKLRVAFANPLDDRARTQIEHEVGGAVQPLVGTLSPLLGAIERAFRPRTTRVVKADLVSDVTRRMQAPSTDTTPLHRLEEEASADQRHQALLLALIDRGALTRADYAEALRRLLRRNSDG